MQLLSRAARRRRRGCGLFWSVLHCCSCDTLLVHAGERARARTRIAVWIKRIGSIHLVALARSSATTLPSSSSFVAAADQQKQRDCSPPRDSLWPGQRSRAQAMLLFPAQDDDDDEKDVERDQKDDELLDREIDTQRLASAARSRLIDGRNTVAFAAAFFLSTVAIGRQHTGDPCDKLSNLCLRSGWRSLGQAGGRANNSAWLCSALPVLAGWLADGQDIPSSFPSRLLARIGALI